jgi:hypothetical protein
MPRPYVLLSVAQSLDGYIDDPSPDRLVLSSPEDLDRVDEVSAGSWSKAANRCTPSSSPRTSPTSCT